MFKANFSCKILFCQSFWFQEFAALETQFDALMKPKSSPQVAPDVLAVFARIVALMPPDKVDKAYALAAERLDLTRDDAAEKLALIIVRILNPDEVLSQEEEAKLRGKSRDTLREMKKRKELPEILGSGVTIVPNNVNR